MLVSTIVVLDVNGQTRVELWNNSPEFGTYMSMDCESIDAENLRLMLENWKRFDPETHKLDDRR